MSSGSRNLGIGVIVVSVAMLLYGVFELAKPQSSSSSPAPIEEAPADGEKAEVDAKTDGAAVPAAVPAATPPGVNPGVVDPARAAPPPGPAGALPIPADPKAAPAAAPQSP
jgi:hypothetical protein